jgi:hypothetical protein
MLKIGHARWLDLTLICKEMREVGVLFLRLS